MLKNILKLVFYTTLYGTVIANILSISILALVWHSNKLQTVYIVSAQIQFLISFRDYTKFCIG